MTGDEADILPAATSVGRLAFTVADVESLSDFYCEVVGLTELARRDDRVELGPPNGSGVLVLRESDKPERPDDAAGLFHAAFRVPNRAALSDALERVRHQWHLDGASDHLVSEALYLTDPEGNGIEIYCDRPRDEWPRPADGSGVEMDTRPLTFEELPDATGNSRVPPATDIGHVHLEVTSLPSSEAFYRTFGLNVQARYGEQATFLAAGDYHHHVGLNTWNARSAPTTGRGLAWVEFFIPDGGLEAALHRFEEHDVQVDRRGTNETLNLDADARVADPDDIELRLTDA